MSAIILGLLSNPTILAVLGGFVATIAALMRGRVQGAQRERDKRAAEELKARDIADQVDSDIGALPPDARREALRKWAR